MLPAGVHLEPRGQATLLLAVSLALLLHLDGSADGKSIPTFAGNFIVYLDKAYDCLVDGQPAEIRMKQSSSHFNRFKPNELQNTSGTVNVTRTIDDKWWMGGFLALRSNNEWKDNAFVFRFPTSACSSLRNHLPGAFYVIFSRLGAVARGRGPCSIPKGLYVWENQPTNLTIPHFPVMPYGFYRLRMLAGSPGSKALFCHDVELHIIPKVA